MRYLIGGLVLCCVVLAVCWSCEAGAMMKERIRADSLAAEGVLRRAETDGWVVSFAEEKQDLLEELGERDLMMEVLGEDLQASQVEVRRLVRLVGSVRGELDVQGQRVDSLQVELNQGEELEVGDFGGEIQDGVMEADWMCRVGSQRLRLDYQCGFEGELVEGVSGDGRAMVFLRGMDDRVEFRVPEFYFQPPEENQEKGGVSWWWVPIAFLGGAGTVSLTGGG